MADPSNSDLGDALCTRDMLGGVSDFFNDVRIHGIEESREQRFAGLPLDFEDE